MNLDVFPLLGLGSPQPLGPGLCSSECRATFMPCLQGVSTCGGVLVSLLCHLTASLTRLWFQLLRRNVSSSACGELHAHLGLFCCVCFNFVFWNFFEALHPKVESASKNVSRANCSDHADTQGILLRSFKISGCSLDIWNWEEGTNWGIPGLEGDCPGRVEWGFFFFPGASDHCQKALRSSVENQLLLSFQLSSRQIGELPISAVFERLRWHGPSLTSDTQGAWLCSLGGFQL